MMLSGLWIPAPRGGVSVSAAPPEAPTHAAPADSKKERIDAILTALQQRSDGLHDIRCKVRFVEDDRVNLSKGVKVGTIRFLLSKPNPRFLIHFEKSERDGMRGKQEWYLFDGRWLYEAIERLKQVTQREMVREGERVDLFDLERAPFPLPFGQKKETILRNFTVTLIPPRPGDPPETDHLVCVPRPGTVFDRKYDKLEFFIHRTLHLPTRVVVTRSKGYEINTAEFPDLSARSLNTGLTEKDFARPRAWKHYKVVVERLDPQE